MKEQKTHNRVSLGFYAVAASLVVAMWFVSCTNIDAERTRLAQAEAEYVLNKSPEARLEVTEAREEYYSAWERSERWVVLGITFLEVLLGGFGVMRIRNRTRVPQIQQVVAREVAAKRLQPGPNFPVDGSGGGGVC